MQRALRASTSVLLDSSDSDSHYLAYSGSMDGRGVGSSRVFARSPRSPSPTESDPMPGLGIYGVESRFRSACAIPTVA